MVGESADRWAVTLDVDWAPDFVVDWVAAQLVERSLPATWFVTHMSPAIERLKDYPELFELGIHPNFLPGTTHGESPEVVLDHCTGLVPQATSMRTHGLMQYTGLLGIVMERTPITADVSIFMPNCENLQPFEYRWRGRELVRVPYIWEDDFEMGSRDPCWRLQPILEREGGVRVINFHPIHIYLNSAGSDAYELFKSCTSRLQDASPADVDVHVCAGKGTRTFFDELTAFLLETGKSSCIRDIASEVRYARVT